MNVYLLTISLVSIFSLMYDSLKLNKNDIKFNKTTKKTLKIFFLLLVLIVLIGVAGFREGVGTDYWNYASNYNLYKNEFWSGMLNLDEPGIRVIAGFSSLIHDHYGTMMFFSSVLTIGLFVYTISKNTDLFFLSILLFIFIGDWHGSFNAVRQYIAASILFFGHKYILKKNFSKYLLIVIIASLFHVSALGMLLLYFVPQKRLKRHQLMILFVIMILGSFLYEYFFQIISVIEGLRGDSFVITDYVIEQINPVRVLVAASPLTLLLFHINERCFTKKDYFYINMLFVNLVFFMVSLNSAHLARITIYTNTYTALAIPSLLKGINSKKKILIIYIILVLYFLFWLFEISKSPDLYNFSWIFS